jgi:LytTr DNA-binding domain
MLRFLSQPYPFEANDLRKSLIRNAFIGIFIAFFLIVFQPLGTDLWQTNYKTIKLLGYGFVSFLMPSLLHTLSYFSFDRQKINDKWVIWKEILFLMLTLVFVAVGNLIYANFLKLTNFSFSAFVGTLFSVAIIGVLPILAGVIAKYNRFVALNTKEAAEIDTNLQSYQQAQQIQPESNIAPQTITLLAENEKDSISFVVHDFVYIESADNYANIAFLKNNKLQKELLRGTLKRFESQLHDAQITRCHRSYIVNLHHAETITGNAQGYRLTLRYADIVVPVARNYGAGILEKVTLKKS